MLARALSRCVRRVSTTAWRARMAIAVMAVLPLHAARAATTDDDMCRNGLFPGQLASMRIATFAGGAGGRLYFHGDMDGCPSAGPQCRSARYVVTGDELIVGKQRGDWHCVWYAGKEHETVGWVPGRQLQFRETDARPDWRGTWKQYSYPGYINIARRGADYFVLGNMKWIGAQLADGSRVEHFGDLGGKMAMDANHARIHPDTGEPGSQYGCAADFVRLGRYLIVHDNAQCGGMNVRFDGVYTQAAKKHAG